METIDVTAPHALETAVARARQGETVLLTDRGHPVAEVRGLPARAASASGTEAPASPRRVPGLHRGKIRTLPGFDDPLPDEFWTGGPNDPLTR